MLYTNTHGYTEQLFGLCYLVGYAFMPRLNELKDQQLYRLDRRPGRSCAATQVDLAGLDLGNRDR